MASIESETAPRVDGPRLGPPGTGWLRRSLPLLGGGNKTIAGVVFFALVSMVAAAFTPVVIRRTIDHALLEDRKLMPWLLAIAGMGVIRFVSGFLMRYRAGEVSLRLEFDLRTMLFEHLQSLDLATHDTIQTGQLTSRANTDVRILQMFLAWMPVLFSSLAMTLISLGVMISWSPLLALVATLPLPLVIVVALRMRDRLFPAAWDSQQRTADIADVVDDAVSGVRVVRAFGQEERELRRLKDKAVALFKAQMRVTRFSSRYMPAMNLIPSLGLVLLLLVGGSMVKHGEITIGQFLAFNSYVLMMVAPIQMLGFFIALGQRARASGERILEIFDSVPTIVDSPDAKDLAVGSGEIMFSNLKFGYVPSAPVLNGLNLRIRPGERVAVVGGNRSGKSTLTTLLPRFYDPQEGSILIDGQDIRGVTLSSLRRQVGIVFEESFLFSGTIRENIAYGRPDASEAEVRAAAEAAGADEFISVLPEKYDTQVGESGFSVSGGQRQRIALARALLGDPKILVLDDATSSVDVKTEAEILGALADLLEGRTTILVASRPSTVALADRVVLLEQGKVADEGTHHDLLERSGLYRELMGHADEVSVVQPVAASLMMGAAMGGSAEGPEGSPRAQAAMKRQADALSGRGDHRGALWISSMPATPELLAKVAALPVAPDEPKIDFDQAAAPEVGFKPRRVIRKFAPAIALGLVLLVLRTAL
ncbi:MAG TPA: ABC transporter ATP-binding protein, partial [Actinomycetota bacterium]|nr:ABC transporter ATP-binding protein [Actinomycetota bacterium]